MLTLPPKEPECYFTRSEKGNKDLSIWQRLLGENVDKGFSRNDTSGTFGAVFYFPLNVIFFFSLLPIHIVGQIKAMFGR